MTAELLARIQFALTICFHYIYPSLSIGLGLLMVIMEGLFLKTKDPLYEKMARFWTGIFALTFVIGVATGMVMEFEFGTNWATYSRFVGDVFGSPLAAEGIFAFFLESTFLGILVFGWDRVSPRTHFIATLMVSLGSMLSAFWIIVANSWQQTPAGYRLVQHHYGMRAEITDFWAMVFNPSTLDRFTHALSGCWLAGAFLVVSVSAYYLLKKEHTDFALRSVRIALLLAAAASVFQLYTGHRSAVGVAQNQPAKIAAFEAHYPSRAPADLYLFGWVNEEKQEVNFGLRLPRMLSWMVNFDRTIPLTGLGNYHPQDRPPVNLVFQTYHLMVALGMVMIGISFLGLFLLWRGWFTKSRTWLFILLPSALLPQVADQLGWISAEVGRQPWIVYELLRTSEAISKNVSPGQILFSLILFAVLYLFLFLVFVTLLFQKVKRGPL